MVIINKYIRVVNQCIPPRETTASHYVAFNSDMTDCIQHLTNTNHPYTGDVNVFSKQSHTLMDTNL